MKNLYDILGLKKSATKEQIRKSYLKKSKILHPDKKTGSKEAFQDLQYAYSVLHDDEKRKSYDATGDVKIPRGNYQKFFEYIDSHIRTIIQTNVNMQMADIVWMIKHTTKHNLDSTFAHIEQLKSEIDKAKIIKSKIEFKGQGDNLFAISLDNKIKECEYTIAQLKENQKMYQEFSSMLEDYNYFCEAVKSF